MQERWQESPLFKKLDSIKEHIVFKLRRADLVRERGETEYRGNTDDLYPDKDVIDYFSNLGESIVPQITPLLEHRSAVVRNRACSILANIGSDSTSSELKAMIEKEKETIWTFVALRSTLGDVASESILKDYIFSDRRSTIKHIAADMYCSAVLKKDQDEAVKDLKELLFEGEGESGRKALSWLSRMDHPDVLPILQEYTETKGRSYEADVEIAKRTSNPYLIFDYALTKGYGLVDDTFEQIASILEKDGSIPALKELVKMEKQLQGVIEENPYDSRYNLTRVSLGSMRSVIDKRFGQFTDKLLTLPHEESENILSLVETLERPANDPSLYQLLAAFNNERALEYLLRFGPDFNGTDSGSLIAYLEALSTYPKRQVINRIQPALSAEHWECICGDIREPCYNGGNDVKKPSWEIRDKARKIIQDIELSSSSKY